MPLGAFDHLKGQRLQALANRLRLQPCRSLSRDRPDIQGRLRQTGSQHCALGIIDIDHRSFKSRPGKERLFCSPISLHGAMVVQMVLREVGEHGHTDVRGVQPVLSQTNR